MIRTCPPALKYYLDRSIVWQVGSSASWVLSVAALACADAKLPWSPDVFRSALGTPHGESWCVEFVQALIAYVETTLRVTSPLPATASAIDLWNRAKNYQAAVPLPGSIVIWQETATPALGHAGIFTGNVTPDGSSFSTVEGNTHAQGDVAHDGDGVYARTRLKGGSESFRMLGFLKVF